MQNETFPELKIQNVKVIREQDFSAFVEEVYGRPYRLQQQDGCKSRGVEYLTVPSWDHDDYEATEIPEEINGDEMGVSFAAWLARDPAAPVEDRKDKWTIDMFWERNFYPHLDMIVDDLHARGLLPAGEYLINIDW